MTLSFASPPLARGRDFTDERGKHVGDRRLGHRRDGGRACVVRSRAGLHRELLAVVAPVGLLPVRAGQLGPFAEQRERLQLVALQVAQAPAELVERVEVAQHPVGRVGARAAEAGCGIDRHKQWAEVQLRDGNRGDAVARGAVVMLGEDAGELAVPVGLDPERAEHEKRLGQRFVGEQQVERPLPPVVERDRFLDGIEHFEAGRQGCLERMFGQDPLCERVQRGDRGIVECQQRTRVRTVPGLGERPLLHLLPDALLELTRRGRGERDHSDLADRDVLEQADDPLDELMGLAGPGAGDDVEGHVEVAPDPVPGGLVRGHARVDGQLGGHSSASRPRSFTNWPTAGSLRFATNARSRSGEQRWSKSQNADSSNELKYGFSFPG